MQAAYIFPFANSKSSRAGRTCYIFGERIRNGIFEFSFDNCKAYTGNAKKLLNFQASLSLSLSREHSTRITNNGGVLPPRMGFGDEISCPPFALVNFGRQLLYVCMLMIMSCECERVKDLPGQGVIGDWT
ncbi:hypothetical protein CDAR_267501 [Caerostris darwini]|uniref:Uncharacterized protein n=1 Tax=Caerostris darwini TaxID=1538125 RepID=A0AAV4THX0_9ARAC|nr:hypothetical protein CDAR_267501 [Caerostris darwini]